MGRREYPIHMTCAEPGCQESTFTVADTRQDEREARERYNRNPWRCARHTNPERVLTPDSPVRLTELEARPTERLPDTLFWHGEGPTSGFRYGPGFKAFARDFPPGTRLRITAEILPPVACTGALDCPAMSHVDGCYTLEPTEHPSEAGDYY